MRQATAAGIVLVLAAAAYAARPGWGPELDREAPPIEPRLLMVARVGGPGDQNLDAVQVRGNRVAAAAGKNFTVVVTLSDDGTVKASVTGDLAKAQPDVGTGIAAFGMKRLGPLTYGYKQVHAILQQPYIHGPGWRWWDWRYEDCEPRKRMADSRCTFLAAMPNGSLYAVGKCDGGNTTLRVHPKDLDKPLDFKILHGGGSGTSSFAYEIDPKDGTPVRQMILNGFANGVCWDRWGRVMVVGRGIIRSAQNALGYGGGAGVLMADREWTRTLFSTHVGPHSEGSGASLWSAAIDSDSGIAAVGGWVEGDLKEVQPIQKRPGGGKDGLLVVLRLWNPVKAEGAEAPKGAPDTSQPARPAPARTF